MPYKDITYDNGFTERVYYNMTASEEAERFKRTNRVKSFPSAYRLVYAPSTTKYRLGCDSPGLLYQ